MHGRSQPMKILFDTDIGSDIDDALALCFLLAYPACEILGITTVGGQVVQRARLARAIVRESGKRIPVVPGENVPLDGQAQRQPEAPQTLVLQTGGLLERGEI